MAMEVTHVRFARDLKDVLDIEDDVSYYSGSVYPDSRYFTGNRRRSTHGQGNPVNPFVEGLSDFEKGWASHFLYDKLAKPHYKKLSPCSDDKPGIYNRYWQFSTAEKVIEDMNSWDRLGDDREIVTSLQINERPRGEDPALLEKYYSSLRDSYKKPLTLEVYVAFWETMIPDKEVIAILKNNVEQIQADETMVKKIQNIYPKVLKEAMELAKQ